MADDQSPEKIGTDGLDREDRYRTDGKRKKVKFGRIALDLGYVTKEQLKQAIKIQGKAADLEKDPPSIREILVSEGYMSEEEAEDTFRSQGRRGGHTEIEGFRLIEKIGKGGMATVFKAHQISMDRTVALKVLSPNLAMDDEYIDRFVHEARSVAKLNHPNIVQGIDVGESNGVHYFVMEFVDGPTVKEIIKRGGAMDQGRALKYTLQVAKALRHADRHQMIHRDVKPDNIMINSSGTAKLCDLGLAQVHTGEDSEGGGFGTPNYISPEQARREPDLNIQTDIYSLGASFYHMLTGRVPYPGESGKEVVRKHVRAPLLAPREVNAEIIDPLNRIVVRMMKKERSRRYQHPGELIDDLQDAGEKLEEREEKGSRKKSGPSRRHRRRRR